MSTDSFACRSSNSRNPYARPPPERRRQWLITRGFLSPNNGPSRRLANLLPRKPPASPASSRKTPSHRRSAHFDLEVDQNSTPVVVAKPTKPDTDVHHANASRTVSMPPDDSSKLRTSAFRSRTNHRRWMTRDVDRSDSPPSRSRRFWMRLKRKSRELPAQTHHPRVRVSIDVPRARDRAVDRVSLHRHSLDRTRDTMSTTATARPRGRGVYTVFDRELPRHILQGNSHFEQSTWNDYRDHIDELAEDTKFMEYLTAPVQRRPPITKESKATSTEPQNLAVNKLYPLAFIRLLEAHSKCPSDDCEPSDPEDEEHRYDDVDRDDEARVERTVSNGMYDMGRFRTVRGVKQGDAHTKTEDQRQNYQITELIDDDKSTELSSYHSRFFSRISRDGQGASVPVC